MDLSDAEEIARQLRIDGWGEARPSSKSETTSPGLRGVNLSRAQQTVNEVHQNIRKHGPNDKLLGDLLAANRKVNQAQQRGTTNTRGTERRDDPDKMIRDGHPGSDEVKIALRNKVRQQKGR